MKTEKVVFFHILLGKKATTSIYQIQITIWKKQSDLAYFNQ